MQRSLFLKLQLALIYIYLPSLQSVLHVFTVLQRSLFLKLQPALIYIYLRVSAICTSRIYSLAVISFPKTSTCAHIYLSPSLQSVLHVFTVLQRSLFLKLQPALIYIYIYISVSAICTSRIYSLAAISFLKTSTMRSYIFIFVSAICTSPIYSLAVISFLKTSTCAHIYLSPSLQSVLHVFTVLQRSLYLKLQLALIYIYLRLCNLYFTYLQSCSDLFTWNVNLRSYISISVSAICTSRIYSLAAISFLKTSTCAHIYLSPSLQSVLHVFTVLQRSLFLKLQPALIYIYLRVSTICTSRICDVSGETET